ncbi:MAG: hypothetical protein AB2L17_01955 [Lentimicrobium sp.]|jgi:hypothetical protein
MLKSKFPSLLASLTLLAILLVSCDKKEDETPQNNNQTPAENLNFSDSYGVLAAVKTISFQSAGGFTIPVEVNTAVAVFVPTPGATTFAPAGTVSINNSSLKKFENNAYVYDNLLSPLSFSAVQWSVSGEGEVPAFEKTVNRGFPNFSAYASIPETFSLAAGLSVPLGSSVTNADSVVVVVSGSQNAAVKTVAAASANAVFSAGELSNLGAGASGMISVTPYNYTIETISGRKYYFVNQSNYTKMNVNVTQ